MRTATISLQGNQQGVLWQVVTKFQPKSMGEQRGHNRIMREFGLDLIEAKLLADPSTSVEMPKEPIETIISEAGYLYLCAQWDHLSDIFPSGVNEDGSIKLGGLPNIWSRILAPLFDNLDKSFGLGDYAESKATPAQEATP